MKGLKNLNFSLQKKMIYWSMSSSAAPSCCLYLGSRHREGLLLWLFELVTFEIVTFDT